MQSPMIMDLEVYVNFTLICFLSVETGQVTRLELPLDAIDREVLVHLLTTHTIITFNGTGYDLPLIALIARGDDSAAVKKASNRIIEQNLKWWNFEREYAVRVHPKTIDHIDLMEVAPLTGSLKLYAARLHAPSIQDLPIEPSAVVTEAEKVVLRAYCENDCRSTALLLNALGTQIALREQMSLQYGMDLRSKSDAQIAEAVIKKECEAILKKPLDKPTAVSGARFRYTIPEWMVLQTPRLLDMVREAEFMVTDAGGILIPPELKQKKIAISRGVYRMGIGGLHSSETRQVVVEDDEHLVIDFDVTGYYPATMMKVGVYPKHIGPSFLEVLTTLVARRVIAKRTGDTSVSASLKVVTLALFGKLGSKWSILYSPDLVVQTTLTGQLAVLMLIEAFDDIIGVEVVSANTDGVTIRCRRDTEQEAVEAVRAWEMTTGFEMERADYRGLYNRDVNNYIAVKTNGEVKAKGAYGTGLPLQKNPYARICSTAVIKALTHGASIEETVHGCQDIRQFVCVRSVKGGAIHRGKPIGRIVRWYYSTFEEESFHYKVNNYLVPNTLGAAPAIVLPTVMPVDLDRAWYVTTANEMLADLGVV